MDRKRDTTALRSFRYNAFISYARAADDRLAPAVRSALHQFAKPLNKLRALRIFLDKAGLPVSSGLSTAIEKALSESQWLLLMASPPAAESDWVRHEIEWWLEHRSAANLLILLTEGDIVWDKKSNDFDWGRTNALPNLLSGRFVDEPLYGDLRSLKNLKHLSLRSLVFRDSIASIAATLHDRPKDELDGEDVDLHRQRLRRNRIVASIIGALTVGLILFFGFYYAQRDRAKQSQISALVNSAGNALAANMQLEAVLASVEAGVLVEDATGFDDWPASVGKEFKVGPLIKETLRRADGLLHSIIDSDGWAETRVMAAARLHQVLAVARERNRLEVHGVPVTSVAYSPSCPSHERFFVSGDKDGKVVLWNVNGTPQQSFEYGAEVKSIAISPDCRMIATGGLGNSIDVWVRGGISHKVFAHDAAINALSFARDGQSLISGDASGLVSQWALDGRRTTTIQAYATRIHDISVRRCPDGRDVLAAISFNPQEPLKVWRLANGFQQISAQDDSHVTQHVRLISVSISPDCSMMVTGAKDGTLEFRRLDGHRDKSPLRGHRGLVNRVGFSEDGERIVSASGDDQSDPTRNENTIRVWTREGKAIATFRGHRRPVTAVAFSGDGKTIVSASSDTTVRLWSVDRLPVIDVWGFDKTARSATISPKGDAAAVVWTDNQLDLMNIDEQTTAALAPGGAFETVVFRGDGSIYRIDEQAGMLRALSHGGDIVLHGQQGKITDATFSRDGEKIATIGDGVVGIWTVRGKRTASLPAHSKSDKTIGFSPDGQIIALLVSDREFVTLDLRSHNKQPVLMGNGKGHKGPIRSLVFSPDGKSIASAGNDYLVKLWDLEGNELQTLIGHANAVENVVFHPSGYVLASSDSRGKVMLWASSGRRLLELGGGARKNIWALKFSGDGRRLIAVGQDSINVWHLHLNQLLEWGCRSMTDFLGSRPAPKQKMKQRCKIA